MNELTLRRNGADQDGEYDVVIIGAGISGTLLATILARHNARVLMIDAGTHPKFAVGESTVGHTSTVLQLMSERYDVPEIGYLASFHGIRRHVTTACGVKRGFGFVYHREGEQRADECNQFVIPPLLHGPENHLFRQDVDAYMMHVAVRYGAEIRQQTRITDVVIGSDGVRIDIEGGEPVRCRYVVDGSGHNSLLGKKHGLRETPTRCKHHARSLFTHMVGVKRYDDCVQPAGKHRMPVPWYQTTLHHFFEGGWIWVIPFDNHRYATNPLCSVGLTVDPRKFPRPDCDPETEFREFIQRFPSVAAQFEGSRTIRKWVSTDRLQFSSRQTVGDRFCLMSHAAGFIDPLFSRGLANTMDVINSFAERLLEGLADDDLSAERFEFIERLQQGLLDFNDQLVHCSYISFRDYRLWNAWVRVWALGEAALDQMRLLNAYARFRATGDRSVFRTLDDVLYPGMACPTHEGYKEMWYDSVADLEAVDAGTLDPGTAADRIFRRLDEANLSAPATHLSNPARRYVDGGLLTSMKVLVWGKLQAPEEIRKNYFGFRTTDLMGMTSKNFAELVRAY